MIPSFMIAVLDITGVSYAYSINPFFFNLIPLLINAAIGFQYLTYNSTIYESDTRKTLLTAYEEVLQRIGTVLTIIYYKILPWFSYCVILGLLVAYDFSLSSWVLLSWVLVTFGVHLMSRHDLKGY